MHYQWLIPITRYLILSINEINVTIVSTVRRKQSMNGENNQYSWKIELESKPYTTMNTE